MTSGLFSHAADAVILTNAGARGHCGVAARADLGLGCRLGGLASAHLLATGRRRLAPTNLVGLDTERTRDRVRCRLVVGEDATIGRALGGRVGDTGTLGELVDGRDAPCRHQLADGVLVTMGCCHKMYS